MAVLCVWYVDHCVSKHSLSVRSRAKTRSNQKYSPSNSPERLFVCCVCDGSCQKRQSPSYPESPNTAASAASAVHSDPDSPVRAKPEDPSVLVAASASTDDDFEAIDAHEFIVDTHGLPADDSVRFNACHGR